MTKPASTRRNKRRNTLSVEQIESRFDAGIASFKPEDEPILLVDPLTRHCYGMAAACYLWKDVWSVVAVKVKPTDNDAIRCGCRMVVAICASHAIALQEATLWNPPA